MPSPLLNRLVCSRRDLMSAGHTPRVGAVLAALLVTTGCAGKDVAKARAAIDAGQPDIAVTLLSDVLADDPGNEEALVAMGDADILLAARASAASDVAATKTALAKAAEAYASAARAEGSVCVGATRSMSLRLLQQEGVPPADVATLFDRCPSAELLGAAARSTAVSEDAVNAMRQSFPVSGHDWSQAPGFGGTPAKGNIGMVLHAAEVAPTGAGEVVTLDRFSLLTVSSVSDTAVQFHDEKHPVGKPVTSWVSFYENNACGGQVRGRDTCRAGPLSRPPSGITPFDGAVVCTGKAQMWMTTIKACEVSYTRKTIPMRSVPLAAVQVQPRSARARAVQLRRLASVLPAEEFDHLIAGEVALGLPLLDVLAVVPLCTWDPVQGVTFKGDAIDRECKTEMGTLTFSGGALAAVSWAAPKEADEIAASADEQAGD